MESLRAPYGTPMGSLWDSYRLPRQTNNNNVLRCWSVRPCVVIVVQSFFLSIAIPMAFLWLSYRQTNNKGCVFLLLVCPVLRCHCCPVLVFQYIPIGSYWVPMGVS